MHGVTVTRFSAWVVCGWLVASMVGCGPARQAGTEEVAPELTFQKLRFRVYRGVVLTAQGTALHASFRRDTADVSTDQVLVGFPGTPDRPEARITATRAIGNLRERRFFAFGGVRAEHGDQVALTSEARYVPEDGLVHGERPVEVQGGGRFTVRGPGFTLDPRQQILRIDGDAQVIAGGGGR